MKRKFYLIAFLLSVCNFLMAQKYESIYDSIAPEVVTVWNRVADYAPVLRSVESACISPDGKLVVSASKFGYNLMVWRVADGGLLWESQENTEIECLVFSPDGKRFATGDEDYFVKVWDTATGDVLKKMEHDSGLDGIAWSHDGKIIAAGSEKGDICFWDATTYEAIGKVRVGSTVNSLDFSKNDKQLVVGGNIQTHDPKTKNTHYGGFVKLIDVDKQQIIRDYKGIKGSVKSVRFSPDEKFIGSGGFDNVGRLFETQSGRLVKEFVEPLKVEAVAFTVDGHYFLTGGHEKKIKFYRLADMKLAYELPTPRTEYIDISQDGRLMLTAHEDSGLISLFMFLSSTQHKPGLYHEIEKKILNNRDMKE